MHKVVINQANPTVELAEMKGPVAGSIPPFNKIWAAGTAGGATVALEDSPNPDNKDAPQLWTKIGEDLVLGGPGIVFQSKAPRYRINGTGVTGTTNITVWIW